jgi:hypothetical protein
MFSGKNERFHAAVAASPEQAVNLMEAGFEYVTGKYNNGRKLFRKRT